MKPTKRPGAEPTTNLGKYALTLALALIFAVLAAGCGGGGENKTEASLFEKVGKYLDAKGRPYGNIVEGKIGETLNNSFFAWTVTGIQSADMLLEGDEEILPSSDENKFVKADIKTENIFDAEIPVGNYDFVIVWEDADGVIHEENAFEEFMEGMYPDEATEEPGGSLEGTLVFELPKDINSGMVAYYEYYEDDFEGDAYMFAFDLPDAAI